MKVYNRLNEEGHQVIMMKPYEKTGRYNKVLYFKDDPNLILPKTLHIDNEKGSFYGYGFYKNSGINKDTEQYAPSFSPYDFNLERVKNKTLYKSIKTNNLIDWREKDFTYTFAGKATTYVNDRDFLQENDWAELFSHYDNNIEFVHNLIIKNHEEAFKFLNLFYGRSPVTVPYTIDKELLLEYFCHSNTIRFQTKSEEESFLLIFAAKIIQKEPKAIFLNRRTTVFEHNLFKWGASKSKQSFKDFMGENFREEDYLKFRYRILLKQDPSKITYEYFHSNV